MNFFKLYIGDYQRDTGTLSLAEHGAYLLMLQHFYATEAALPTGRELYRLLRCETKQEREAVDSVSSRFWDQTEAGLVCKRAQSEIAKAEHQRTVNREIGKRGGRPKKTEIKTESVIESEPNDNPNQTPDTRHQTKTNQVDTHTQYPPPEGVCVSPVADCCKALVDAGIQATTINQAHPKLLALVEAGATAIEFGETARECVGKGNGGFAYVLGTMTRRREQAAATKLHQGAMPRGSPSSRQARVDNYAAQAAAARGNEDERGTGTERCIDGEAERVT